MKRTSVKMILLVCAAIISVIFGVGVGSVYISPGDIFAILANHLFGVPLPETVSAVHSSMVMDLRLPRVLLAFCTGGALAVSGTVMQSVLKNPLASSYGLGVSAGAGLGASLVMEMSCGWLSCKPAPVMRTNSACACNSGMVRAPL